ncbi:MAG: MBL fold metallo-hydrolase [Minisyncoccia bacterium]
MKLTFFGGAKEIGGNKILLQDKGTNIFLDFGKSYKEYAQYFEEFVNPRTVHGIKDYLELDLIPYNSLLYRDDLLEIYQKEEPELFEKFKSNGINVDGVLVSHGHFDHIGYLAFIKENIPVFLTLDTKKVLETYSIFKPPSLENEIINISIPHSLPPLKRKKKERKIEIVSNFKKFVLKDLEIIPIFVDHSVPGATMYLIKGSKNILYSGDFRLSEIPEKDLEKIYQFLSKEKIDYFLCEGTRIKEMNILREKDVFNKALNVSSKVKGLIVADYSLSDITRFKTLNRVALEIKRKIALPFNYFAYLSLLKEKKMDIGDFSNVVLYEKKKGNLKKWEKELLRKYSFVDYKEIRKNQNKYLVILNFYQIQELIDLQPNSDSYYLRAITEPHSEESEISEERFINWVEHFKMQGLKNGKFERAHISGHVSGKELEEFIAKIKPDLVIPIHTEYPEEFKKMHKNVIIVEKGKTINI